MPWRGLRRAFQRFPHVDVSETDDEVRVVADIPGVDPNKVDIRVTDDVLTISGTTEQVSENTGEKMFRYERVYGSFRRQVPLPARVKADAVRARAKNGVLTITLPKSEEEKRRRVTIETEE